MYFLEIPKYCNKTFPFVEAPYPWIILLVDIILSKYLIVRDLTMLIWLKNFKKVFKDYQTVLETLKIAQYSVGNTGVRYLNINQANKDPLLDEGIIAPAIKNNDNEDIVAFYENVLRQNQVNNDEFNRLKELMEDELSQMFIIDSRGNRIYY